MKEILENNIAKYIYVILLLGVGLNYIQEPKLIEIGRAHV